ncbi:MAG: hypothetical protein M0Z28_15760 [Rhodospirillales bacterium]|nr:hypothetical protein [Rhodospirillales bacterium]
MGKPFSEMSEHERQVNRQRIKHGLPADYEADERGIQTPESRERDRERREATTRRASEAIARRRGLKGTPA